MAKKKTGKKAVKRKTNQVLVIDDDLKILNIIKQRLLRREFEVSIVASGRHALTRLRKRKFDCVILDLIMPEVSGKEVLETISNERLMSVSKVIVLTGIHNVQNATAYMQFGAFAYIGKPFDCTFLMDSVQRCCDGRIPPKKLNALY